MILLLRGLKGTEQRIKTLIQFARTPTPENPAAAKEAEAAKVMADTLSTVPTFTSMLAKIAVVITFCCSCSRETGMLTVYKNSRSVVYAAYEDRKDFVASSADRFKDLSRIVT